MKTITCKLIINVYHHHKPAFIIGDQLRFFVFVIQNFVSRVSVRVHKFGGPTSNTILNNFSYDPQGKLRGNKFL